MSQYNPEYNQLPFTNFHSVDQSTTLSTLNFNWREQDLPERVRTKHVHRLHPYLGKFIPQLVEIFLRKYKPKVACDPFCGSGTTLVEANALGITAVGCDISSFNCLLSKVKTDEYDVEELEREIRDILDKTNHRLTPATLFYNPPEEDTDNEYLRAWFSDRARKELLYFRSLIQNYQYQDVLKVILSRAARSARLTTHFDLDFPKEPQIEPYYCYKHRRICKPTDNALQFLKRYGLDALRRIKEFAEIRTEATVQVICGDSRTVKFPPHEVVITSPPYVGLIDYHEQHRYAYELLGLENNEELEIGAASRGSSRTAQEEYIEQIGAVFENLKDSLDDDGIVVIVIHDKNDLYKDLAPKIGFRTEEILERHVNRRTGRRASAFFEEILIWRKAI